MNFYRFIPFLVVLVFCFGCGRKDPRAINLIPIKGSIVYQQEPLADASIVFTPMEGGEFMVPAIAISDAKGQFLATTYLSGDGIHPGQYTVTVFKEIDVSGITKEKIVELEKSGQPIPKEVIESVIPIKYNSTATSGLTVEINKKGINQILLELTGGK